MKWENAFEKLKPGKSPKLVLGESNRITVIIRDILNGNFENIYRE